MSEETSKKHETYCGLLLAVFAAVLAITDLGAGKYGDDEMISVNEKSSAYLWYQSKGIKHDLTEGRYELLNSLLTTGAIAEEKRAAVDTLAAKLLKKMAKYKKEKEEILNGSVIVGKENWVQETEVDLGKFELGKVIGAKEWEANISKLGRAGDYFDGATLFLQLCIVMGAISLISPSESSKKNFFTTMIVLGIIGSAITTYAFILAN